MADIPESVSEALTPGQEASVRNALTQTEGDLEEAMNYALGDGSTGYESDTDY